jgi:hypothetical protein
MERGAKVRRTVTMKRIGRCTSALCKSCESEGRNTKGEADSTYLQCNVCHAQ